MQAIKAAFQLEEEDFIKFRQKAFVGGVFKKIYFALILIVTVYFFYDYIKNGRNFLLVFLSALNICSYIASYFYFIPRDAKREYADTTLKENLLEIEADDTMVKIDKGNGRISSFPWDSFRGVWNKWGYYSFYISKNYRIQMPERCLSTGDNIKLRELIKNHVKPSKRKNPSRADSLKNSIYLLVAIIAVIIIITSFLSLFGIIKF